MIQDKSFGSRLFSAFNYTALALLSLFCLLPIIHIVAVSFSARIPSMGNLVGLWPIGFNTYNYQRLLATPRFLMSFQISVGRTVLGTLVNMLVIVLTAYPLAVREWFPGKEPFKWYLVFAMLFSGGLIPWFLVLKELHLTNSFLGLILPRMVDVWSVLIMINYFRTLPQDYTEAAQMDGATHWDILLKVYIPLALPMLAALALFQAVFYWNDYFDALVLIKDSTLYPLQTYLQTTILSRQGTGTITNVDPNLLMRFSERAWRAAQIVVSAIPILVIYPFVQRYFVTMRLGGIKG
jgi:putative aldouronate transport system permease protein